MKTYTLYFMLMLFCISASAQTYLDPEDNLVIESNSWIIFNPGNYTIPDVGNDGLIQIDGKENIVLDGTNVNLDGTSYQGYFIKINNSSYIEIKNFSSVKHYYYAVYITNSDHITIEDNDFSYNKVDSTGWISIWTNYQQALGGGVMMYETNHAQVNNNVMHMQNDGVALYHCDSIHLHNNLFDWNTSFGIRMYFTDNCDIQNNEASHINRPFTNPSDCASILLIVSNNNNVVSNTFTHSGDGIFLGQFQYSQFVNNNYFAYNECSYSPHNAIEATFADGNVFEYNNCNYSHYGLWLGYSYNSVVRNNEIIGNQYSGIAIDRGYNNQIYENVINDNPNGIELWEGSGIPPYATQNSGDYFIHDNHIEGNTVAISLKETEHSVILDNEFINNRNTIYIFGDAENDTLSSNLFSGSAFYHIENNSAEDIYAVNNDFVINDESIIACKIFDKDDNGGYGTVTWQPYMPGEDPQYLFDVPADMAEPGSQWYAYPEACWGYGLHEATTVEWDTEEKMFGEASVHVSTGNGWDIGVMYRPGGDSIASFGLVEEDTLKFWLKSINNTGYGFQYCSVVVGNYCGGYYKYTAAATTILNPTMGLWKEITVPLEGAYPWSRSSFGDISFDDINYVEIHADTWEYGFELWIDGVTFTSLPTGIRKTKDISTRLIGNYPNPAFGETQIEFYLEENSHVQIDLFNVQGAFCKAVVSRDFSGGYHKISISTGTLPDGIYYYRLTSGNTSDIRKLIISK